MPPKKDKDVKLFNLYLGKKFKQCEQQIVNHIANKDQCDELTWLTYSHNKLICQYFLFRKNDPTLIDELIQLIEHFVKQPIFKKKKNHKKQKSKFEFLNGQENQIKIQDLPLYFRILRIAQTILALCIKHEKLELADIICDHFITRNGQNIYFMKQKVFFYFYIIRRCESLGKMSTTYEIILNFSKLKTTQLLNLPRQIQVQILLTLDKLQIKLKQSLMYQEMQLKFRQDILLYEKIHCNAISLFALKRYMQMSLSNGQYQQKNQNQQLFYICNFFLQYTKTLYTELNNLFMPLNNKFQFSEWNLPTTNQNFNKLYKFFKDHNNAFKIVDILGKINTNQIQIFLKCLKASRQQCLIPDNLQPGHYATMDRASIQINLFLSLLCLVKNKHNCQMTYNYMKRIQKSMDYNYMLYYRKGQCCINLYLIILQQNQYIQLNANICKVANQQNKINIAIFQATEETPIQRDQTFYDKDINRKQFEKNVRWKRLKSLLEEAQTNFRSSLICLNAQKLKNSSLIKQINQSFRKQPTTTSPLQAVQIYNVQIQEKIIQALSFVYLCLGKYSQCLKLLSKVPQSNNNQILKLYKMQCQSKLNKQVYNVYKQNEIKQDFFIQVQNTKNYYRGEIGRTLLSDVYNYNLFVLKIMQGSFSIEQQNQLLNRITKNQNHLANKFLNSSLKQFEMFDVCRAFQMQKFFVNQILQQEQLQKKQKCK